MTEKTTPPAIDAAIPRVAEPSDAAPVLTVIVPVYNEAATVSELLARVVSAPYAKQVIVVDDGSTDATADALRAWQDEPSFMILRHETNRGKGQAIRTALDHARAPFTMIQDADLQYDAEDYPRLIEPLLAGEACAVFGSRYLPDGPPRESVTLGRLLRTVKSRAEKVIRNAVEAVKSAARTAMSRLKARLRFWLWFRQRKTEPGGSLPPVSPRPPAVLGRAGEGQGVRASASVWPPPARRRRGFHPITAAGNFIVGKLYGVQLTDVAASPKAFATGLLRALDLKCERFDFNEEVTAKLCAQNVEIREVPVHFDPHIARPGRQTDASPKHPPRHPLTASRRSEQRGEPGRRRRWSDGVRGLATLWRWRHWAPVVPEEPDGAVSSGALIAARNRVRRPVRDTVQEVRAAGHVNEADDRQAAIDDALWQAAWRTRAAAGQTPAEFDVDEFDAAAAATAGGGSDQRPRGAIPASASAAAAAAEPWVHWERFARKAAPVTPDIDDSEDVYKGEDWKGWNLTDVLLLMSIVNIGLVMLVVFVPPFSTWQGAVMAALASATVFRVSRAARVRLDKANHGMGILAILTLFVMLPIPLPWRDLALLVMAGLAALRAVWRVWTRGIRQGERSLLDVAGVLTFLFAGLRVDSMGRLAPELLAVVLAWYLFLVLHFRRGTGRTSDNAVLVLTSVGTCLVLALAYLFPLSQSIPWYTYWLKFRYAVLPHWSEIWWFNLSVAEILVAVLAALLLYRAKRGGA